MSLLMQALQKAAKEREGTTQSPGKGGSTAGDLALEPLEGVLPTRASTVGSTPDHVEPPNPAQAAAILQATQPSPGIIDWIRDHRKTVYGGFFGLILVAYGTYFYISIYHPALLRRPIRPAAAANTPLGTAPPVAAPQIAAIPVSDPPAASPPSAAAAEPASTSPNDSARDLARRNSQISTARIRPQATSPASAPAAAAEPRQRGNGISVRPGGELPKPKPELTDAYESLRMGRVEDARKRYDALLLSEPRSVDALLGRATVAQQQGDLDTAIRYFYQVVQLDPANTLAQGGLINLLGRADPQSAESRLKALVAKDPSAFLYFALGNLYADQGNWPAAQSAYFQAHHLQSDNADYLFNLAVSLEHLNQPRLALGFYRQALDLARSSGRSSFDFAAAQERVAKLAATVD